MSTKSIVIVYEPHHIKMLGPHLAQGGEVFALDRHAEYLLEEQNIAYISAKPYRGTRQFERIVWAEKVVKDLFKSREWDFFSYRGISLGEIFRFSLQEYLDFFLYYVDVFASVAEAYPGRDWVVLGPTSPPPRSGGPLARYMHMVVSDAARLVAEQTHVRTTVVASTYSKVVGTLRSRVSALAREVSGFILTLLTSVVALGVQKKKKHILTSDLWRNIKTIIREVPDTDITLCDRSEVRHIPWQLIRSRRMAFLHLGSRVKVAGRNVAVHAHQEFVAHWRGYLSAPAPYGHVDIAPQLTQALTILVTEASLPTLLQIEEAYRRIPSFDLVLLRASVSGQTHHVVLALVARAMGVPAIELQHGLEYLGPGSLSLNHTAEYIATYGPLINKEFIELGYEERRLLSVGSPRFDTYAQTKLKKDGGILCIGPDIYPGGGFDSYDAEEYFKLFFSAVPAWARVVVKLRANAQSIFLEKVITRYKDSSHELRIETVRPLPEILSEARFVVSCYSTAILEALQCGIPTAQLVINDFDYRTSVKHFEPYLATGIFTLAQNASTLRELIGETVSAELLPMRSQAVRSFMKEAFCFDGRSTWRIIQVFNRLLTHSRK